MSRDNEGLKWADQGLKWADQGLKWADLGNGLYRNPVLYADFSDPDVIRVLDTYYMVVSDFHFMGMQLLASKDLVNWRYIKQIYRSLEIDEKYAAMSAYAQGSWAPSIRYHNGRFYVYFCTPGEGLYMTSSEDPAGEWEPLHAVLRMENLEDPCPFWDDDGTAWLGHSTCGAGPIIIHRMSPDGRELLDDGKIVYVGKVAEGTKIIKRNGWYYLVIPEGGVKEGWQTVLRSHHILGPYEKRITLKQGRTTVNGPHQGSIVDTTDGQSYFVHFQDRGTIGRVCHLQPLEWVDDWPEMGVDGEPVEVWNKPEGQIANAANQYGLASDDDFSSEELGPQWQWNHNPVEDHVHLDYEQKRLRIKALPASNIENAYNTLTQKLIGERARITVSLGWIDMQEGQIAGLAFLSGRNADFIAVTIKNGDAQLSACTGGHVAHGPKLPGACRSLKLAATYDLNAETRFFFSFSDEWINLGGAAHLAAGCWKGSRPALFTYISGRQESSIRDDSEVAGGIVSFSEFVYDYDQSMQQL